MKPPMYIVDEVHDMFRALTGLCLECRGRGCVNCVRLPAAWEMAEERTPPLIPDRVHALDRAPVSEASLAAADCPPAAPAWALTTAPVPDREAEAAEVLRILTAARREPR